MEHFSSMYIDNELDLEEKQQFVEHIHNDGAFYTQTLELLSQERLLRTPAVMGATVPATHRRLSISSWLARLSRPLGFTAAGFCSAVLLLMIFVGLPDPPRYHSRFVLYQPDAKQVSLTGSFIQWQRLSMTRVGRSGYWELRVEVPMGEHRYAYILDGDRRIADPTLASRELDDFGGVNSIFLVGERI